MIRNTAINYLIRDENELVREISVLRKRSKEKRKTEQR